MASRPSQQGLVLFSLFLTAYLLTTAYAVPNISFSGLPEQTGDALSYHEIVQSINLSEIRGHVEVFSSFGSRVTGYPGFDMAAEYIYNSFTEIGLADIRYEYFDVAVPIDYGANITVHGSEGTEIIKAYPLWPNLIQTCPTPSEGIRAPLVYAGKGLGEIEGESIEGRVVLMEFDSRDTWKRMVSLGARAIVFVEGPNGVIRQEAEFKVTNTPVYVPRIYVTYRDGERLRMLAHRGEVEVTIVSKMRYEMVRGKNVVGFLPGTGILSEVTAISAYFDSFSYVPSLSPGAEESLGISTLLELARFFKEHPPLRTLQFIAFGGHHECMAGATQWTENQFNNTITKRGKVLFRVQMIFALDYSSSVKTLGLLPHDSYYPVGGAMYYEPTPPRNVALHAEIFSKILPRMVKELGSDKDLIIPVAEDAARLGREPIPPVVDSSAFEEAGGIGFGLRTTHTMRTSEYVPSDTPDNVRYENLAPQLEFTYILIAEVANMARYVMYQTTPERVHNVHWGFGKIWGQTVLYNYTTGWYDPLPNALVYLRTDPPYDRPQMALYTNIYHWIGISDANGKFLINGVRPTTGYFMKYIIEVYKVNWTTGVITYAPDMGEYGHKTFNTHFFFDKGWLGREEHPRYFVAFPCSTIAVHGIIDPTTFNAEQLHIHVNDLYSHSPPLSWGSTQLGSQRATALMVKLPTATELTEALVFISHEDVVEILVSAGYFPQPAAIAINASELEPTGIGYTLNLSEYCDIHRFAFEVSENFVYLVGGRLESFAHYNVYNPRAIEYYDLAVNSFSNVRGAFETGKFVEAYWGSYETWAYFINAYFAIMDLNFEVIYSSIAFYILLLPFAFLAERLVFHLSEGRKRLVALILIFGLAASFLYLFHPGFHIASNVTMATLGFTILVLALPVIVILSSELMLLIGFLRRRLLGAHFTEIHRTSAILTALSVGVENMRKRKFRASLTLVTITILVFSMVSFTQAGFSFMLTKSITWTDVPTPYSGILVRELPWRPLADELVNYVQIKYDMEAWVAPRFWGYGPQQELAVVSLETGESFTAAGVLGLSPYESKVTGVDKTIINGSFFDEGQENSMACVISQLMAERLGVEIGDSIGLWGIKAIVMGIMDGKAFARISDMDQEPLSMRDILTPLPPGAAEAAKIGKEIIHADANTVVLVPYGTARRFFNKLPNTGTYAIAIKFRDANVSLAQADKLAKSSRVIFFATLGEGDVNLYVPRKAWATGGMELIIVPLIIGIFIILNTMLGAVMERIREIGTFSTLGLSPMHVAGMFLAESVVYGIIAATLGYMAGMACVNILASLELMPEQFYPNFSSYYVLIAVGFSLLATMLSTVYPMLKASRLVTPTLERKWKPDTSPRGRDWEMPLPFTRISAEIPGVMAFIKEYFDAHGVERAGLFMASEVEVAREGTGQWVLTATVKLQPFDLGIVQHVRLISKREPRGDRNRFILFAHREAGPEYTWLGAHVNFAKDIRRQLLLWSSVRAFEREDYLERGSQLFRQELGDGETE